MNKCILESQQIQDCLHRSSLHFQVMALKVTGVNPSLDINISKLSTFVFRGLMFAFTRFLPMTFTVNDCFFFGAIISATDPGNNIAVKCGQVVSLSDSQSQDRQSGTSLNTISNLFIVSFRKKLSPLCLVLASARNRFEDDSFSMKAEHHHMAMQGGT